MVFSIRDASGNLVRRLTGPASKGIHRIAWDLRSRGKGQDSGSNGLFVLPGKYSVSMASVVMVHGKKSKDHRNLKSFSSITTPFPTPFP